MTRRHQRRARKGEALKIRLGRPWHLRVLMWSFLAALNLPSGRWRSSLERTETSRCCPQGQRQSILPRLLHPHRVVPAQVQILLQGYTSAPLSSFRVFRSWCPPSGHSSEYRVRLHRHRPPIEIHLVTTPIGASTYENSAEDGRLILMVFPDGD
jgi:hypothetical protein